MFGCTSRLGNWEKGFGFGMYATTRHLRPEIPLSRFSSSCPDPHLCGSRFPSSKNLLWATCTVLLQYLSSCRCIISGLEKITWEDLDKTFTARPNANQNITCQSFWWFFGVMDLLGRREVFSVNDIVAVENKILLRVMRRSFRNGVEIILGTGATALHFAKFFRAYV